MNKQALIGELDKLVQSTTIPEAQIFVRLVKQVWQIDWTVAAYDVLGHYLAFDVPYFWRFMQMDLGDEAEEKQLINDWIDARMSLKSENKKALVTVIDQLNQIKMQVRTAS